MKIQNEEKKYRLLDGEMEKIDCEKTKMNTLLPVLKVDKMYVSVLWVCF